MGKKKTFVLSKLAYVNKCSIKERQGERQGTKEWLRFWVVLVSVNYVGIRNTEEKFYRQMAEQGFSIYLHMYSLLPEVDVFQVAHSEQSTQLQNLYSVSSHGQLVHSTQSLQHSRDVSEVVEGQPQTIELGQAT